MVLGKRKWKRSNPMGNVATSTPFLKGSPAQCCTGSLSLPTWHTSRISTGLPLIIISQSICFLRLFLGHSPGFQTLQFCSGIHWGMRRGPRHRIITCPWPHFHLWESRAQETLGSWSVHASRHSDATSMMRTYHTLNKVGHSLLLLPQMYPEL